MEVGKGIDGGSYDIFKKMINIKEMMFADIFWIAFHNVWIDRLLPHPRISDLNIKNIAKFV